MTDREFWAVMAENIAQARSMPGFFYLNGLAAPWGCKGLCALVECAYRTRLITKSQMHRLERQIYRIRPANADVFYWPEGDWRPRVRAMRRLAKMVRT